jgi:vacuolar protein sorting-associated protein 35
MSGGFGGTDDQDRLLDEATAVVKEQAFYMKRAMDNDNLREALKHASNLICELRTSLLSPKNYYELYMQVFQEMQHLSAFFSDKSRHGRKMLDLYESVQHAGNILPRMYLLATVGASYIKSQEAPAKEILKDMSELTKGVQHPIRGLFLRYYLSQMVKDKLPDTGSEYEAAGGGNIEDAFDFILTNFMESNRLWVRISHQGPMKDKQKRDKERHDLRVLVGANLVRLSQLEGMTVEYYADNALPKLLEHVLSVKDQMSQQYLFESMIQVFPDEFHIRTLEQELNAYTKAQPAVDMKPIMCTLMKRLSDYLAAAEGPHALTGVDIFALFRTHLDKILERVLEPGAAGGASAPDISAPLELQAAFMSFTLTLYPERHHYVDIILGSTVELLNKYFERNGSTTKKLGSPGDSKVVDLLNSAASQLGLMVLEMEQFGNLTNVLNFQTRKQVCLQMVKTVIEGEKMDSVEKVENLFNFIGPLIKDEDDTPNDEASNKTQFAAEQSIVCQLVHHLNADVDNEFAILQKMRSFFGQGGEKRLVYTLAPMVYGALGLISKIKKWQEADSEYEPEIKPKKIFQFVHKTITVLNTHDPPIALQLWLSASVAADKQDQDGSFEGICYEFMTQGMIVFEEEISDGKKQSEGIYQFIGILTTVSCLEEENFFNLANKVVQHANRLLKKPMQVQAISNCAQLFWCKQLQDGKKVLECLQKCLKTTDTVVQSTAGEVGLWVEMLDRYVFFIESLCESVTPGHVDALVNLCQEHISYAEQSDFKEQAQKARTHFNHTKAYLKYLKNSGTAEEKALFGGVTLGNEAGGAPL